MENKTTTKKTTPTTVSGVNTNANNPLPVLNIGSNLIIITDFLSAIESANLPSTVVSQNPTLANEYAIWQESIWDSFFESLLNGGILAQALEINNLITDGITNQSTLQSVMISGPSAVPTVISMCDDMLNQISAGNSYLTQLQTIANQIKGADQQKIAQLNKIVTTLNTQFNSLENELTKKALDSGKEVVITTIDVGVKIATEEDPIAPLIKGIAQVGFDVIDELIISSEINDTLLELETAWAALDEDTLQLAQINLILNQLNEVLNDTSKTISALNNIVNDWQEVYNVISTDTPEQWKKTGISAITEWAARMNRIQFGTASQTVS
jgi:hypothetical protein